MLTPEELSFGDISSKEKSKVTYYLSKSYVIHHQGPFQVPCNYNFESQLSLSKEGSSPFGICIASV